MKYSKKMSEYFLPTLKEDPREAEIPSHKLMIRSGMIRKLASGVYEFLPLGWRTVRKIEEIIREELDAAGAQEIVMSAMQPRSLWEESGRWDLYGPELMRLKDRGGREFCLGPTHEEVVTKIVSENVRSYKQLPVTLYQFQMKFRDEIRPRFGVMRAREFYMKDSYSFDADLEGCRSSYDLHFKAYKRIFERCGLEFAVVEADTGNIGGEFSHEFMVLASTGEEEVAVCSCGYGASSSMAGFKGPEGEPGFPEEEEKPLQEVHTPGVTTVQEVSGFLSEKPRKFIKTLIFDSDKGPVAALVRGDHELCQDKLLSASGAKWLNLAEPETVKAVTGGPPGFSGPCGAKIPVFADEEVLAVQNAVSGAGKKDYHLININFPRDYTVSWKGRLRKLQQGDLCLKCGGELKIMRGIEVGHTFLLGTKYSSAMGARFVDKDGREKDMIMGCYGIGVTRVAAAAIEQNHDSDGIIWPAAIAPFEISLIQLSGDTEDICRSLYEKLSEKYEVLWDDRDESPGVKFKDAQLLGLPVQIIVGKSYMKDGKLEVVCRRSGKKEYLSPEGIEEKISI